MNAESSSVLLFQSLAAMPDEPAPMPPATGVAYLIEALIDPLLADDCIDLCELDYDAFEEEDIREFRNFFEEIVPTRNQFRFFVDILRRVSAAKEIRPAFC